jgi:hypothetical protein
MIFLQYLKYSYLTKRRTMTVNPRLATLMRVIEDNQDKMPEGEYLDAMNALCALHREIPAAPVDGAGGAAAVHHHHPPPPYNEPGSMFAVAAGPEERVDRAAWYRVTSEHPEHFGITEEIWMELPQEVRDIMLREATEMIVNNLERTWINPDPEVCPFVARHAVGSWRVGGGGELYDYWNCACGYTGKTKHWQKHEESKRHQDWAKHRTVSDRIIKKMKKAVERDERGDVCRYKPQSMTEFGGIRYFPISQERNEWTHPELFADPVHLHPIPTADGTGTTWFVHPRVQRHNSREYLE